MSDTEQVHCPECGTSVTKDTVESALKVAEHHDAKRHDEERTALVNGILPPSDEVAEAAKEAVETIRSLDTESDDDLRTDGGTEVDDTERCDYCDGTELVYEFEEATRGRCYRCIRCLALEQAQNQQRPLESYGGLDDELLQHAWQQTRDWLTILCRLVDDDPIIKRDPDTISTVEESTRTFLTNVMGADAHRRPSELRGEQA